MRNDECRIQSSECGMRVRYSLFVIRPVAIPQSHKNAHVSPGTRCGHHSSRYHPVSRPRGCAVRLFVRHRRERSRSVARITAGCRNGLVSASSSELVYELLLTDFTRRLRRELRQVFTRSGFQRSTMTARPLWQLPRAYFSPSQPLAGLIVGGIMPQQGLFVKLRLAQCNVQRLA